MFPQEPVKKSKISKLRLAVSISLVPALSSSLFFFGVSAYANASAPAEAITMVAQATTEPSPTEAPVLSEAEPEPTATPSEPALPRQELESKLREITTNSEGTTYAIAIIDLKTEQSFGQNQDRSTHSASVMKTLVAAAAYKAIENGELSLDSRMGGDSVQNHLRRMINRSDNGSWELFYDKLGIANIQALAAELGMSQIKIDGNEGTAQDFAKLLHLLYNQDLINSDHREQLFGYMQDTETENLLTLGIPKGVNFYHKTGKYAGGMHDAMIVDIEKNPYVIVVLSSNDRGMISNRSEKFKQISKAAYQHFNQ